MGKQVYELNAGGHRLYYRFRDARTVRQFALPLTPCEDGTEPLEVDDDLMRRGKLCVNVPISEVSLEHKLLLVPTARRLLRWNACVIHSAAFLWRGYAWLLAAASGVGKTTQYRRWRELCGDEVQIISGDMPIIGLQPDGSVLVSPSPWPGEEGWSGGRSAPLGGVILLEQADRNEITRLSPQQGFDGVLKRFLCRPDTVEEIHSFAALLDAILTRHPLWLLRNRGDLESAELTRRTLEASLKERNDL